jgi:hypothetical protein
MAWLINNLEVMTRLGPIASLDTSLKQTIPDMFGSDRGFQDLKENLLSEEGWLVE